MNRLPVQVAERLRRFVRKLKKDDDLESFIGILNATGEAYLFGGAPRDVAFGAGRLVNDLDIFVSGPVDIEQIRSVGTFVKRTNFGGFRLVIGKYEVDVWELDKSYAFRFDASSYISTRNLLNSVCFSTDGIALSLKSGRSTVTSAFLASLRDRRLDFVVPPPSLEPVVAARIARLALKLELGLTPAVASYFVECVDEIGVPSLIDAEARWGRHRMLNEMSMEQVKLEIKQAIFHAYQQLRATP